MPCLFSELKGTALPNIVKEISKTKYLNHIIIGLDKTDEKDVNFAFSFFRKLKLPFSILWNDGPNLKRNWIKNFKTRDWDLRKWEKEEMFGIV